MQKLLENLRYPIFYILAVILFFAPALINKRLLAPPDSYSQDYPTTAFISQEGFPLWNPFIFSGFPVLADPEAGFFSPLNVLFLLFPAPIAMNIAVLIGYILAGYFTFLYLKTVGASVYGSFTGGLIFTFSGFLISHLEHPGMVNTAALLPLLLMCIEKLRQHGTWGWFATGSIATAMMILAGHPQITVYALMVSLLSIVFCTWSGPWATGRWRFFFLSGGTVGAGVMLSACQLLPSKELADLSWRTDITYSFFTGVSLPPEQLLTLIFPYLFGALPNTAYKFGYFGAPNIVELSGYVGLLPLMLAGAALPQARQARLVLFWIGIAILSLLLSLGGNTPFYRLMFYVPGYNAFRVPARHLMEFNLAVAVLAALGLSLLFAIDRERLRRRYLWSSAAVCGGVLIIAAGLLLFGVPFFRHYFPLLPEQALHHVVSIYNPAVFVPVLVVLLALAVVWSCYFWPNRTTKGVLLLVLAIDLCSFGQFCRWRLTTPRIEDLPREVSTINFLKRSNPAVNTYRIFSLRQGMSYADFYAAPPQWYFPGSFPNYSMLFGISKVEGYRQLMLSRYRRFVGDLRPEGWTSDLSLLGPHRGLDLLNSRYLFIPEHFSASAASEIGGLLRLDAFNNLGAELSPKQKKAIFTFSSSAVVNGIGLITALVDAAELEEGEPVARVTIQKAGGNTQEHLLRAGHNTAVWDWDRPDLRSIVRHQLATVAKNRLEIDAQGRPLFVAHLYLASMDLGEWTTVEQVAVEYMASRGRLIVDEIAFYDLADSSRWKKLTTLDGIDIYENLRALPRAWLVPRVQTLTAEEILQSVKTGYLPDGSPFDPRQQALVEDGLQYTVDHFDSQAKVEIMAYQPDHIELSSHSESPGFLVISEIYYPGWKAIVDGQEVTTHQTNYILRGIELPAGRHHIELIYDPASFKIGLLISGITLMGLVGLCLWSGLYQSKRLLPPSPPEE